MRKQISKPIKENERLIYTKIGHRINSRKKVLHKEREDIMDNVSLFSAIANGRAQSGKNPYLLSPTTTNLIREALNFDSNYELIWGNIKEQSDYFYELFKTCLETNLNNEGVVSLLLNYFPYAQAKVDYETQLSRTWGISKPVERWVENHKIAQKDQLQLNNDILTDADIRLITTNASKASISSLLKDDLHALNEQKARLNKSEDNLVTQRIRAIKRLWNTNKDHFEWYHKKFFKNKYTTKLPQELEAFYEEYIPELIEYDKGHDNNLGIAIYQLMKKLKTVKYEQSVYKSSSISSDDTNFIADFGTPISPEESKELNEMFAQNDEIIKALKEAITSLKNIQDKY